MSLYKMTVKYRKKNLQKGKVFKKFSKYENHKYVLVYVYKSVNTECQLDILKN